MVYKKFRSFSVAYGSEFTLARNRSKLIIANIHSTFLKWVFV